MNEYFHLNTRYINSVASIKWGKYKNGRPAMQLISPQGEPLMVASVNLDDPLEDGEMFIKDYSENEGTLASLVANKIVEDTGKRVPVGFVEACVVRLLVEPS